MEGLGAEVNMMESNLEQERESFEHSFSSLSLAQRQEIDADLTRKADLCQMYRATLNEDSAVAEWQRTSNEAQETSAEEVSIPTAAEQAFVVQISGTDALRSPRAFEEAKTDFEAVRLMRDILDPGWRVRFADSGMLLETPAELEYLKMRNDIWRQ